jgi:hypothetical protein
MAILTDKKSIETFLRKFKNALTHEFRGMINIKDE